MSPASCNSRRAFATSRAGFGASFQYPSSPGASGPSARAAEAFQPPSTTWLTSIAARIAWRTRRSSNGFLVTLMPSQTMLMLSWDSTLVPGSLAMAMRFCGSMAANCNSSDRNASSAVLESRIGRSTISLNGTALPFHSGLARKTVRWLGVHSANT